MNFKKPWFFYGIFGLVLVCFVVLGKKYILDKDNIQPDELVIYMSIFIGFIALIHFFMDKKCRNPLKCKPKIIINYFQITVDILKRKNQFYE